MRLVQVSDFGEFDQFAGVFALLLHLAMFTLMMVVSLGSTTTVPKPPIAVEVAFLPELPAPMPEELPPPPPAILKPQDSAPVGKSNDSGQPIQQTSVPKGAPPPGELATPSENRILNEPPKPRASDVVASQATSAATPSAEQQVKAPQAADTQARAAAADTQAAGKVDNFTPPASPVRKPLGASQAAGEGILVAAGVIRGNRPDYPPAARRDGLEGKVILRVTVLPDGRIRSVVVLESSGHPILDRAARDGVVRWRFAPARNAYGGIVSVVEVPIEFKLADLP